MSKSVKRVLASTLVGLFALGGMTAVAVANAPEASACQPIKQCRV